jgi:threonyl-tRNA synthetase
MEKMIDLSQTIYQIHEQYPEIRDIMVELGFQDIAKPGMLQTAGRFMTLPKGAAMKKIDLDVIRQTLKDKGFQVIG